MLEGLNDQQMEAVTAPEELKTRNTASIHIRLSDELEDEDGLDDLRDFVLDCPGRCDVYLHLPGENGDRIIRASSAMRISDEAEVLERLRRSQVVVDVWREHAHGSH